MTQTTYPIGTPGIPWGINEKRVWLQQQRQQRSYQDEVVEALANVGGAFELIQYGELDYQAQTGKIYPLYLLQSINPDPNKPFVLVTGGVHGYETSGVHGALRFAMDRAGDYLAHFNIVVAPCLSPWGYETINRWNPLAIDPNRSFRGKGQSLEAQQLVHYLHMQRLDFFVHIDLHETTDTDNSEFRPALAAREGTVNYNWNIPDGFYLVADAERPQPEFQRQIISAVSKVTHIADADDRGQLIGADIVAPGVIEYSATPLGLCMGLTGAPYVTTTEVYPDSPRTTPKQCVMAQVAAITGGLDSLIEDV